jgi:prolycopene isomerase
LGDKVKKIKLVDKKAGGVFLADGGEINSKYVVSACDMVHTYYKLVGEEFIDERITRSISRISPSASFFLTYIGLTKKFSLLDKLKSNIFVFSIYNLRSGRINLTNCKQVGIHVPSAWDDTLNADDTESVCLSMNTKYASKEYWDNATREEISNRMISLAETVIPDLSKYISLIITATPLTLENLTGNYKGAAFGWASTPQHFGNPEFSQKTTIENLYITGHWSNRSSGITFVANSGRLTADLILQRENLK